MTLEEYLKSIGYSEQDINETMIRYEYEMEMPEQVNKDILYWIFHIKH